MNRAKIGIITGLQAEAKWLDQAGFMVQAGGGTPEGAKGAAQMLVARGVEALLSFGLAGGLQPGLPPGTVLVPAQVITPTGVYMCDPQLISYLGGSRGGIILAGQNIAATVADKASLYAHYKASAIDLESGAVAEIANQHALPFAVLRAIADPAERTLPPAALVALKADGSLNVPRLLGSILAQPTQLQGLIKIGKDAAAARKSLLNRLKSLL